MGLLLKAFGALTLLVIGAAIFGGGSQTSKATSPEEVAAKAQKDRILTAEVLAVRQLRQSMKNPDSFKFESATRVKSGELCVFYRATNSFNAIIPGYAVITAKNIDLSDAAWRRACAGKSGEDRGLIKYAL